MPAAWQHGVAVGVAMGVGVGELHMHTTTLQISIYKSLWQALEAFLGEIHPSPLEGLISTRSLPCLTTSSPCSPELTCLVAAETAIRLHRP